MLSKRANGTGPAVPPKKPKRPSKSLGSLKKNAGGGGGSKKKKSSGIADNDWRNVLFPDVKEKFSIQTQDAPQGKNSDRYFDIKNKTTPERPNAEDEIPCIFSPPLEVMYANLEGMGRMTSTKNPAFNSPPWKSTYTIGVWLDPPPLLEDNVGLDWTDDFEERCKKFADGAESLQNLCVDAIFNDPKAQFNRKNPMKSLPLDIRKETFIEAMRTNNELSIRTDEQSGRRYMFLTAGAFTKINRTAEDPTFDESLRKELENPEKRILYCEELGYKPKFINLRQRNRRGGWDVIPNIHKIQLHNEILSPGNIIMFTYMPKITSHGKGCGVKNTFFRDICLVSQSRRERLFEVSTDVGEDMAEFSLSKLENGTQAQSESEDSDSESEGEEDPGTGTQPEDEEDEDISE